MKVGSPIDQAILTEVGQRPGHNPTQAIQKNFAVSRETVRLHLNKLIKDGLIVAKGSGKGRTYVLSRPLTTDTVESKVDLRYEDLRRKGEDGAYDEFIEPNLQNLSNPGLLSRVRHVSTEILNNVIDHSQATNVVIQLKLDAERLWLEINDDGLGVFRTIKDAFKLDTYFEAVGELAKGKRTRDVARHAGEGIFFSSRMANRFFLSANDLMYVYDTEKDDWSMQEGTHQPGSKLIFEFSRRDVRSPKDVFDRYTQDFCFMIHSPRLVSPYTISLPQGEFPSRSEAKKILAGAEDFASIVIDFKNVQSIGQGFADEMFRVFPLKHPNMILEVRGANQFILQMIAHVGGTPVLKS